MYEVGKRCKHPSNLTPKVAGLDISSVAYKPYNNMRHQAACLAEHLVASYQAPYVLCGYSLLLGGKRLPAP